VAVAATATATVTVTVAGADAVGRVRRSHPRREVAFWDERDHPRLEDEEN
jgi:hypothetical protein